MRALNPLPQIEPTSTDNLLTSLALAIDETKILRSITKFRNMARNLTEADAISGNLKYLNREIACLEQQLTEVRNRASKS